MKEPGYSKAEQAERMRHFEHWVRRARKDWRNGLAFVIMSFADYLKLDAKVEQRKRKKN